MICRSAIISLALLTSISASSPAIAQVPAAGAPLPYRVNPGDELEVYVWGEERLQRVIRVLPDGTFSFPLVGLVEAAGKLPKDLEGAISRGLSSQFRDQVPQVTVSVKSPSGLQFSVIGKVKSPGSFTPGKYINVLEAIGIAGGPTEFAQMNDVLILRKRGGALAPIRVRLGNAMRGDPSARDLEGLPELQPGDTVIVP